MKLEGLESYGVVWRLGRHDYGLVEVRRLAKPEGATILIRLLVSGTCPQARWKSNFRYSDLVVCI